jgi:hypothetical protein
MPVRELRIDFVFRFAFWISRRKWYSTRDMLQPSPAISVPGTRVFNGGSPLNCEITWLRMGLLPHLSPFIPIRNESQEGKESKETTSQWLYFKSDIRGKKVPGGAWSGSNGTGCHLGLDSSFLRLVLLPHPPRYLWIYWTSDEMAGANYTMLTGMYVSPLLSSGVAP